MRLDLPTVVRNPISLAGAAITTAMAVLFAALLILELTGQLENPYIGLFGFIVVPAVFVIGLLLIPLGAWQQRKREAKGLAETSWPVIDLGLKRTRNNIIVFTAFTCINLLIVSLGAFQTIHHMETREFCGTTCHQTMEPEWRASAVAPHAKVACVSCHVGPGAKALVESKIAGTRQLWHVMTNSVTKPVPVPVHNLRTANEVCATCHWSELDHGDKVIPVREYADDEANTESVTMVKVHVGGGRAAEGAGKGIHWHMNVNNRVEFVAKDPNRQEISYIKFTDRSGKVTEFYAEGVTAASVATAERRVMDCLDCHNRPAHTYEPTAERAIDNAIARGAIPRDLPFVRREAIAAVKKTYESNEAAEAGIAKHLLDYYKAHPAAGPSLERAIAGAQDVYSRNVFPAMKVAWSTYPNNIGHMNSPGCFRCHDESHKAADGKVIGQDCSTCHDIE